MTYLVELLFIASIAILAAILVVGFFAIRDYLQKRMLNKSEDQ